MREVGTRLSALTLRHVSSRSVRRGFAKHLHLIQSKGESLHWPVLGMFVLFGVLGSLASTPLGRRLPQAQLQCAYSGVVVLMAAFILWQSVASSS